MKPYKKSVTSVVLFILSLANVNVLAATDIDELRKTVESLQRQLEQVQQQLQQQEAQAASKKEVAELKKNVESVRQSDNERNNATSLVHLAGYGSVGYTDNENTSGRFSQVQFSPIFHYMYDDLMMLESELEITNDPDGETSTELEYLALDLFLNDYVTLTGGKFLSPIGQFRQNLHPGWINKIPSAPPGFGHDGAAPVSETGLQLRGGFPVSNMKANYAVYVANGPELTAVDEDSDMIADEIESIAAEGHTRDVDGDKVFGGRIGLLPMPGLEVAFSAATGKAIITSTVDEDENEVDADLSAEGNRDYDVIGVDFNWDWRNLNLRGEYVKTKIGDSSSSAIEGANWKTWYTQAAWKFAPSKFEGVLRYTDFDSPHASEDQQQWAVGMNYLFAPNVIGKLAYEANDGQAGAASDDDSLLLQMSYGF